MKKAFIFFIFSIGILFSCKDKPFQTTITGHVFNVAENTDYTNGEIILQEFDNGIEGNSRTVGTAFTDANGNFSITFKCMKSRLYSVFTEGDNLMVSSFEGYKNINESFNFKGNVIPSNVELTCATKAFLIGDLIHNQGSDSLIFQYYHIDYEFVYPRYYKYINEENQGYEISIASGKWVYRFDRYKNGVQTTEVDSFYLAPNSHVRKDLHY